jgi:hypothetical protein
MQEYIPTINAETPLKNFHHSNLILQQQLFSSMIIFVKIQKNYIGILVVVFYIYNSSPYQFYIIYNKVKKGCQVQDSLNK